MRVYYCDADGGDVVYAEEVADVTELLDILMMQNGEINIFHNQDYYLHGKYASHLLALEYNEQEEIMEKSLKIYFDRLG